MRNFIKNIEFHFKDSWQSVFKRGTEFLLSPAQMIEIFYFYNLYKHKKIDRDLIMYKMSEFSMVEMVEYLKKIQKETMDYLS